jgi:hypothetical protein
MYESKYTWNEDTIDYFVQLQSTLTANEVYEKIQEFVERDCSCEDYETEDMLALDLYNTTLYNYC